MAYNKDTQTITSPVTERDVQLALGTSVNTLQGLCTHPNINIWSWRKPMHLPSPFPDLAMRNSNSGFTIVSESGVNVLKYDPPRGGASSFYRLPDFIGYNHKAPAFKSNVQKVTYVGAPANANIYLGNSDNAATFNVEVYLPEIPTWLFANYGGGASGIITVARGVWGTPSHIEDVGSINVGEMVGYSPARYATELAGKKIMIPCRQTTGLPAGGSTSTSDYYVRLGSYYLVSLEYNHTQGILYRQFVYSPNDPSQYVPSSIEYASNMSADYYVGAFSMLSRDSEAYSYLKIKDFKFRTPNGIKIEVEIKGVMTHIATLSNDLSISYYNGAASFESYAQDYTYNGVIRIAGYAGLRCRLTMAGIRD